MSNENLPFSDGDIEDLVDQSRFIFKGEIRNFNDATVPFGKISENTNIARVKVTEILHAPKMLGNYYTGKEITVQLLDNSQKPNVGHQTVSVIYHIAADAL